MSNKIAKKRKVNYDDYVKLNFDNWKFFRFRTVITWDTDDIKKSTTRGKLIACSLDIKEPNFVTASGSMSWKYAWGHKYYLEDFYASSIDDNNKAFEDFMESLGEDVEDKV